MLAPGTAWTWRGARHLHRAFVAYRAWNPKYFVVPANMVPFDAMIHALAAGRQPMPFVIISTGSGLTFSAYRAGRRSVLR